jgi:hypothetical protein
MAKKLPKKTPPKTPKKSAKQKGTLTIKQAILPATDAADSPLADLTLIHVRLIGLTTQLEIKGGKVPDKASIQAQVGVGYSPDNTVHVDAIIQLVGRPGDAAEGEDCSALVMTIHYQCVYRPEEKSAESFQDKAEEIARPAMLVMWPQIRELVQSISFRMSIPPLILPMFMAGPPGKGKGVAVRFEDVNLATKK